eukprot:Clim_evm38s201 gene=Clim_evmTU38s201
MSLEGLNKMSPQSKAVLLEAEVEAYAEHFNVCLTDEDLCGNALPIEPAQNIFEAVKDGCLLAGFIHEIRPQALEPKKIKKGPFKNDQVKLFETTENHNYTLQCAKQLGIVVVNVGAEDMRSGSMDNPDLVLGVIWQLIRFHLLSDVNLINTPELIRLMEKGETLKDMLDLTSEQLLIRWMNYHLRRSGSELRASNFTSDLTDSTVFAQVMCQICPGMVDEEKLLSFEARGLSKEERAQIILEQAEAIGCKKFASVKAIVNGSGRLNLGFTATLFNNHMGISLPTEEEIAEMKRRIAELEAEVDALKAKLREMENENKDLQAKYSKASSELESLRASEASLKEQLASAQELNKRLSSELDSTKTALEDTNVRLTSQEKQNADLVAAYKELEGWHEELKLASSKNMDELQKTTMQKLEDSMKQHKEAMEQKEAEKEAALEAARKNAAEEAAAAKERYEALEARLADEEARHADTQKALDDERARFEQLLRDTLKTVRTNIWESEDKCQTAEKESEDDEVHHADRILKLTEAYVSSAESKMDTQATTLKQMKRMNELIADKVKTYSEQLIDIRKKTDPKKRSIANLVKLRGSK